MPNVTFGSPDWHSGSALSGLLLHLRFWQRCICLLAFVVPALEAGVFLGVVCRVSEVQWERRLWCVVWCAMVWCAGLSSRPGGWGCLFGLTGMPHRPLGKKIFIRLC